MISRYFKQMFPPVFKINNKEQNDYNCKTSELKICLWFIFFCDSQNY